MKRMTRRAFLKTTGAVGAAIGLSPYAHVRGANDDIGVGVVGFRGQGSLHIRLLRELPGARVVALCDPDRDVLDRGLAEAEKLNQKAVGYTDVRRLLEDPNVDAVTTATPDHWHALVTIWACQAGKDVYVEKPLAHNLWEGRQIVEAARKYNRIVQFGNQDHGQPTGDLQLEREGLGKIRVVYTALNRLRESIGKVDRPQPIPAALDYNLWCGPAPQEPLQRKNLHYDWHWVWATGTGELGNNGVYPLDACRLALGQKRLPRRVLSLGGRFLFNDDGEMPNSQMVLFQYEPGPLVVFELRNLPSEKGPKTPGVHIRCEGGTGSLPPPSLPAGDMGGFSRHKGHLYNFLQAVRSRNEKDLRAPILEGHLSTALVHLGNISYRLGTPHSPEDVREGLQERGPEATEAFAGFREHLEANGVDFSQSQLHLGPWLEMDSDREQFVGATETVAQANQLLRREYREPFVVPEQV